MFKPNFNKGLILKQHMLEALRDYPYTFVHILFLEMGNGILSGLKISLCEDREYVRVSEGLVKLDSKVYFLTEEVCLKLEDGRHYVYLEVLPAVPAADGSGSTCELCITQYGEEQEASSIRMELFRYGKNAVMMEYQNIQEICRDTSNRIDRSHALKSVVGGSTLCDEYYEIFAEFLLHSPQTSTNDIGFAYQCLNGIYTLALVRTYFQTEDISNDGLIQWMKHKVQTSGQQYQLQSDTTWEAKPEIRTIYVD